MHFEVEFFKKTSFLNVSAPDLKNCQISPPNSKNFSRTVNSKKNVAIWPDFDFFCKKSTYFLQWTVLEEFLELGGGTWQFFGSSAETFKNEVFLKKLSFKILPIIILPTWLPRSWNYRFLTRTDFHQGYGHREGILKLSFSKRLRFRTFQHLIRKTAKSPLLTPKTLRERSIWIQLPFFV